MKRLALLVVALAILCLFVSCESEPYQAPPITKPYLNFVNETGMPLRIDVYGTDKDNPTDPVVLKYHNAAMLMTFEVTAKSRLVGYGVRETKMYIDEVNDMAYPVDVITKVKELPLNLENKVYLVHVTYDSVSNEISFDLEERQ